jgi:hypothetical protein
MQWDMETITPGDYTLQYEITAQAYAYFMTNVYPEAQKVNPEVSVGESLKVYLKRELEHVLTRTLQQRKSEPGSENINISEVKIADIVFAFSNAELIRLLKVRGQHIVFQRYDAMRAVEQQISDLKNQKFNELIRPVDAFITFEEEDGMIIGQEFEAQYTFFGKRKPSEKEFMGDELFLEESTEPTNIIWENRHWTAADYAKRTLQVVAIVSCLLAASFLIIYTLKSSAIDKASMYPNVNPTKIFEDIFNKDFNSLSFQAKEEYKNFVEDHEKYPLAGFYQTFCAIVSSSDEKYAAYKGLDTENICATLASDKLGMLVNNQIVTISIVAINFILRLFIIKLIIYIGKDTESEQTRLIANGVFIVQFFNTALLLLMVNANLSEQGSFFKIFSREKGIPDFNSQWFNDIGTTLVGAMMFNVYWPVVEFFVFFGMRSTFRLMDRGFACRAADKTKKTTIQQYVELYSGPVFFIHYKYSSILNITFVSMMYGLGLPVLFPIASLALLTLYCMEKLMLHYAYREPPMYDERLNKNALGILTWAPLLFLAFGSWMFASKQLFSNEHLQVLEYSNSPRKAEHLITGVFSGYSYDGGNVSSPLIITFWILLILTLFRNIIYKALLTVLPFLHIGNFEIDEGLDNYFNTIDDEDRKWSIREEQNARDVLSMKILTDETLRRFQETKIGESHMKGTHCYDILANEQYLDDFQYFSAALDDRGDYIKDDDEDDSNDAAQSDLVRMVLNLAFMNEKRGKSFTFDKSCYSQRGATNGIN